MATGYIPRSWKPKRPEGYLPTAHPGQAYCGHCELRTVSSQRCDGCGKILCRECRVNVGNCPERVG